MENQVKSKNHHKTTAWPARLQDCKTFKGFDVSKLEKDIDDHNSILK